VTGGNRTIRERAGRKLRVTEITPRAGVDERPAGRRRDGASGDRRTDRAAPDTPDRATPRTPDRAAPETPGRDGAGSAKERPRPRPRAEGEPRQPRRTTGERDQPGRDDGRRRRDEDRSGTRPPRPERRDQAKVPDGSPPDDGARGDGAHDGGRRGDRHDGGRHDGDRHDGGRRRHKRHVYHYYYAPWSWLCSPRYYSGYYRYGYLPPYSCWYAFHYGYTSHVCRPFRSCVPWYCSGPSSAYSLTYDYIGYPTVVVGDESEPCPTTMAQAWDLLARGFRDEALDAFICHVEADPFDGLPKVGSGLAAGQLGRSDEAIRSMRDAARLDPESLLYVPVNEALAAQIELLVEEFDDRARSAYGDVDALFMVATLNFLLGREGLALYVLDIAMTLGDDDEGTLALRQLVESSMAPPEASSAPAEP
jgi:hypothetical protein